MNLHIFEKGFNYSQDGPGNRLVYHLCGCNFHCPWCSNPEGLFGKSKTVTTEAVVREIVSARPMFFDGGGVTFTGGECSLQADALLAVIAEVKDAGVHVAIESNAATADFLRLATACDTVIADYKHPDAAVLREVTGGELAVIERNLLALAAQREIHLRIPLIHGFNDDAAATDGFLRFFSRLPRDRFDLEILPYHEYGKDKWHKLGHAYTVTDGAVTLARVRALTDAMRSIGVRVVRT